MTLRHYYPLRDDDVKANCDLTRPEGWDELRKSSEHFLIPETRHEWQRMCEIARNHDGATGDLPERAYVIADLCERYGLARQVISLGVGMAALEYHLKRLFPEFRIYCSDFSPTTVERLQSVFTECDGVRMYDLKSHRLADVFPEVAHGGILLMHRIDTTLPDEEWRAAFQSFARDKVEHILLVPHRLLTPKYAIRSILREWLHRAKGTPLALSGYIRTLGCFEELWGVYYETKAPIPIGSSGSFLLTRKNTAAHGYQQHHRDS